MAIVAVDSSETDDTIRRHAISGGKIDDNETEKTHVAQHQKCSLATFSIFESRTRSFQPSPVLVENVTLNWASAPPRLLEVEPGGLYALILSIRNRK